jgi:hypothetical protein
MEQENITISNLFDDIKPSNINSSQNLPTLTNSTPSSSQTSNSFYFWLILGIIILLSFVGINIFIFLAKGLEGFSDIFKPIVKSILKLIGYTSFEIVKDTETGIETSKNFIIGAIEGGIENVKQNQNLNQQSINDDDNDEPNYTKNTIMDKIQQNNPQDTLQYKEDDSSSNIQTKNKSGYCYIGEDKGIRYCESVGVNDKCVSGNIYPTEDLCIHPNFKT